MSNPVCQTTLAFHSHTQITARFDGGNKGAASHIVPILKRIVKAIRREVGKELQIEIRADSGFATFAGRARSPRLAVALRSEDQRSRGLGRRRRVTPRNPETIRCS